MRGASSRTAAVVVAAFASCSPVAKGERPMAKVIKLLRDMGKQLETEKADDDAVHEHYQCWCKKEKEAKDNVVKLESANMATAKASAEASFAEEKEKRAVRNKAYDDMNSKKTSLQETRERCMSEAKEASAEAQEYVKTITALKSALTILGGHNKGLLQMDARKNAQLRKLVDDLLDSSVMEKLQDTKPERLLELQSLLTSAEPKSVSFLQQPVYSSYSSQSGRIFGILSQMLEEFERDSSAAAKKEEERQKTCKSVIRSTQREISALQTTVTNLDARLGELVQTNADAKADYAAADEKVEHAKEFLDKLASECAQNESDYASRTKSRNEEMLAIEDTIKILDNDEAFEAFGKSLSFLQTHTATKTRDQDAKNAAMFALRPFAQRSADAFLIQTMIKAADKSSMGRVIEAIKKLIAKLNAEQKEEVVFRDTCVADVDDIDAEMRVKTASRAKKESEAGELEASVEALTAALDSLKKSTEEMQADIQGASEQRAEENKAFVQEKQEHDATQAILMKAIKRMHQVYGTTKQYEQEGIVAGEAMVQQPGADVVQFSSTADTPGSAPVAFTKGSATEQNAGGKKVIKLLEDVIADSEKDEAAAEQEEADSQSAYDDFVRKTTNMITANKKDAAQKTERKAAEEIALGDAKSTVKSLGDALFDLTEQNKDVHAKCDFVLVNFTKRQASRTAEVEAAQTAIQYLQGMA
ncbi:unnamed protein product [Amoebophrya sp. A25]|nr:unnamed protein product [Amoebophrya sp. A25]|eukprot:GSA25T00021619001.1